MRTLLDLIFGDYWYDPSIIELVLWFPHLSWRDFCLSAVAVLSWNWVCDGLWRIVSAWGKGAARQLLTRAIRWLKNVHQPNSTTWRPPPWPARQSHIDAANLRSLR